MIELPEALTIARQMNDELKGKTIMYGNHGNSPHKFAFTNRPSEEYETIFKDRIIGESRENGALILTSIEPDYILVLGGGGERILYHQSEKTIPKKYQIFLEFGDETYLTVTVQGWGSTQLFHQSEAASKPYLGYKAGVSPLSDEFTYDYFRQLFEVLKENDPRSVKYFIISKPGIFGVANGYLQDILFRAKISHKKRAIDVAEEEKQNLYNAIKETIRLAVELGGRDTERDLYNRPGDYIKLLDSRNVGKPCPECGTPIQKIQYLGGASYFCPSCQV